MILRFLLFFILLWLCPPFISGQKTQLQSPDEFLPYKIGTRFTPHHLLVDYFRHIAETSDKVNLIQYGETYELRPLIAAIISSPQNINQLESIRQNNLRRTGMAAGEVLKDDIAIVQLSYSIHGNEAAGSESSMAVLYALAKGGPEIDAWLANTIVIIDPCLNPDGYSRFSHWSDRVSNQPNDPRPESREHHEPWPGGRTNHYYFDLNRDWVWLTQKESRDRIAFYLQWMPHVLADLHEMSSESPYFFAPAAQPYHSYVTPWQTSFQVEIGSNHAGHFDKEGWRYYTKEDFDLFYPSYGDTYSMFSGAIGMTYEQGGSGFANRALILKNGDTLTLADRVAHHYTTSLSTIEITSRNAARLVKEFESYYRKSSGDHDSNSKSYVIKKSNHPGRIHDLKLLLDRQGIVYGSLNEDDRSLKGFNYQEGVNGMFTAQRGDLIIPGPQPRSVLLNVLFEPEAALADSLTYDITAWSVPMAYGLSAFSTSEKLDYEPYHAEKKNNIPVSSTAYAYAIMGGSVPSSQLLCSLLSQGIIARYARSAFKVDGIFYPAGTILLMRADNRKFPGFDAVVREKVKESVVPVTVITTGFVEVGKDLGSDDYAIVKRPEVLMISGSGTSSQSVGQVWHFFEEELKYPVHMVESEDINEVNLENYNVFILPEGFYNIDKDFTEKMASWIRSGGRVIALGSAINYFAGKEGYAIKSMQNGTDIKPPLEEPAHYPEAYDSQMRKSVSDDIGGAVFKTIMDKSHPLTFGLGDAYWTLKLSPKAYGWLPSGGNALYLDDRLQYYGFAGTKAREKIKKSLVVGREVIGGGSIIYFVDNPLFRSFWNSGKVLFSNALFF